MSNRIVMYVILCSSLITIFTTLFQLYIDYRQDKKALYDNIYLIEESYLQSISSSLYNFDIDQIKNLLYGILKFKGIEYIEINETGIYRIAVGNKISSPSRITNIPIYYKVSNNKTTKLGNMMIFTSLQDIYKQLFRKFLFILGSNAIKTFLVSIFILIIIRLLVTKNLTTIADYAEKLDLNKLDEKLVFSKRNSFFQSDEFYKVASAINDLRLRLKDDITSIKKYEIDLKSSEDRFRQLTNASWEALIIHDGINILLANDYFYSMFGYEKGELPFNEIFTKLFDHESLVLIEKYSYSDFIGPYEIKGIVKDSSEILIEVRVRRIQYKGQKVLLSAMRDITERVWAEEEVKKLRNYLKNIIDSMPSIIAGVNTNSEITLWNLKAEEKTNVPAEEAIGKKLETILPYIPINTHDIEMAIKNKTPHNKSKVIVIEDDQKIFYDITIYPLIANGSIDAVIRIDDTTEEVKIEEMIVQYEKMLSVGELAAGMAHEINNPLAGILHNSQVIKNRFSEKNNKNIYSAIEAGTTMDKLNTYLTNRNIHKMLDMVIDSGERAAKIVNNMLSFSRKSSLDFSTYRIDDLLDQAIEIVSNDYNLKKKYDFKNINIIKNYSNNIPDIQCDGNMIQQVFLNIIKNGAYAISERSNRADSPFIKILLNHTDDKIIIDIEDNGSGMDEQTRKRIFEPFFTTKDVGVGTGLGLSVSYFIIVENHSGNLSVESTEDVGTKFMLEIPISQDLSS
ncbi:MAG: PAS domain S-box protein [Desulfobacterales bacterium]|nr:PAS domain S-box protein [Desulfobacterales bacterium]